MKTKLLFSTIQNCKNGIFMVLVLFLMTVSSFGQQNGIEFEFECPSLNPTTNNVIFGTPDGETNGFPSWSASLNQSGLFSLFVECGDPCEAPLVWEVRGPGGSGGDIVYSYSDVFVNGLPSCDANNWLLGNIPCSLTSITCIDGDNDGDGFNGSEDCNDDDDSIYPGAPEICDGLDNDCDGQTDEGLPLNTYYADTDADGYGDPSSSLSDCSQPVGYVTDNTDCDDLQYDVNPGAPEICDGVDNNCSDPNPAPDENDQLYIDEGVDDCINGVIIDYCDDQQKKVLICHNGKTKCISINAMDAHLAHGDYLGPCGSNSREGDVDISDENPTSHDVVSWPNPSNNLFNIKMITPNTINKVNLKAFDINGRLIHSIIINGNEDYQFGGQLSSGVYFVRLSQANNVKVIKVIKR